MNFSPQAATQAHWLKDLFIQSEKKRNNFAKHLHVNLRTIDQIFTLFVIAQKQLVFNRKLYVKFIDFKKAFDSVIREKL